MAKSISQYKDDYKSYRINAAAILGIAAGCGISQNYFGMIWTLFMGIMQKKMSDAAYKRSGNAYEYLLLNSISTSVREELVKNIKTLEINDLEGIFAYYCFLLRNNYLSFNRSIPKYQVEGLFNEEPILAALTLNNHGVCRNIGPFLTDLYRDFNIDSKNVICDFFKGYKEMIVDVSRFISEEDIRNLEEKESVEEMVQELNNLFEKVAIDLMENGIIGPDKKEHHCINLVSDDEYSYLLDASTFQYYIATDEEGKYASNRGNYFKVVNSKKLNRLYKDTMSTNLEIPKPLKTFEEMSMSFKKHQDHIKDNVDVIDKMHKDIEPMLVTAEDVYKLILLAR